MLKQILYYVRQASETFPCSRAEYPIRNDIENAACCICTGIPSYPSLRAFYCHGHPRAFSLPKMATKNVKKHYSDVEKHLFMEILKVYSNIIEQKRSDCSSLSQKEEAWDEICSKYNASHLISTKVRDLCIWSIFYDLYMKMAMKLYPDVKYNKEMQNIVQNSFIVRVSRMVFILSGEIGQF